METPQGLLLGIESTALPYGIMLVEAGQIIFNSLDHDELRKLKDAPAIVEYALRESGRKASEITGIMVNQGPGGTSSVRSGISFANSLAYSRKIPVAGVNAFELMGAAAEARFQCPVLITIKSIRGNAYGGWYVNGQLEQTLYGPFAEVVQTLVDTTTTFAVAGAHRERIIERYPQRSVHDSGQKFGEVRDLLLFLPQFAQRQKLFPQYVLPLTEQSELFRKISI